MDDDEGELAYYEDIEVGQKIPGNGSHRVTREEIIDFARQWDARSFHVDEEAARRSIFGGLIASGSHVMAIWTRLSLAARRASRPWAMLAGLGSQIDMRAPTRPGDELRYAGEVIEKRPSSSRPDAGIVRAHHRLTNQRGEVVFESVSAVLVQRRACKSD